MKYQEDYTNSTRCYAHDIYKADKKRIFGPKKNP